MPSAGDSGEPSVRVIFCWALRLAKQYQGRPRRQDRQLPHGATPGEDHKVAGRDVGHVWPDLLNHAGSLVAQQERELVVDGSFAIVQIGVADTAGLHTHQRLAFSRIWHQDLSQFHRCASGL